MTTAEINAAVKTRSPPSPADNVPANKRASETKYDAIISNALQVGRRLSLQGYIERPSAGVFRATVVGIAAAKSFRQDVADIGRTRDELFGEEDW